MAACANRTGASLLQCGELFIMMTESKYGLMFGLGLAHPTNFSGGSGNETWTGPTIQVMCAHLPAILHELFVIVCYASTCHALYCEQFGCLLFSAVGDPLGRR